MPTEAKLEKGHRQDEELTRVSGDGTATIADVYKGLAQHAGVDSAAGDPMGLLLLAALGGHHISTTFTDPAQRVADIRKAATLLAYRYAAPAQGPKSGHSEVHFFHRCAPALPSVPVPGNMSLAVFCKTQIAWLLSRAMPVLHDLEEKEGTAGVLVQRLCIRAIRAARHRKDEGWLFSGVPATPGGNSGVEAVPSSSFCAQAS